MSYTMHNRAQRLSRATLFFGQPFRIPLWGTVTHVYIYLSLSLSLSLSLYIYIYICICLCTYSCIVVVISVLSNAPSRAGPVEMSARRHRLNITEWVCMYICVCIYIYIYIYVKSKWVDIGARCPSWTRLKGGERALASTNLQPHASEHLLKHQTQNRLRSSQRVFRPPVSGSQKRGLPCPVVYEVGFALVGFRQDNPGSASSICVCPFALSHI